MKKILPILITLSMLLTACTAPTEKSDKLTVITSFYAMNDFVKTIGGEDIVYHCAAPAGAEPHDFEPTAADMARLSECDVFVYNGGGIDAWAEKVAVTLDDSVITVCTSDGIEADGDDPHIWLDFNNAKKQMTAVCEAFMSADSANAENYKSRCDAYLAELDALEKEYAGAGLDGKKLFVTHGAYGYLCSEFGMEQIALEGIAGDSDPSPAKMAEFVDMMKAEGAKCIFYDPTEGDKVVRAVAGETGAEPTELYTFEVDNDREHRDYLTVMRFNLEQLKKGLN